MDTMFVSVPSPYPFMNSIDLMDTSVISCSNPVIGFLLGCTQGVPGLMHNEHGISCIHATEMSPQRLKACVQYTASLMPQGSQICTMDPIYKQVACSLMKIGHANHVSDDDFEIEWNSFVADQMIQADELEDM